ADLCRAQQSVGRYCTANAGGACTDLATSKESTHSGLQWLVSLPVAAGSNAFLCWATDRNSYGHVRRVRSPKALRARSIALRSASGLMKKNPRLTAQKNDAPNSVQIHLPIGKVDLIPITPAGLGTPKKPSGPITFGVGKPLITPIVPIRSSSKTIVGTVQAKSDGSHRPTWLRLMMVLI